MRRKCRYGLRLCPRPKHHGSWSEITKLTAADGAEGDLFGYTVSLFDTTAVVGAIRGTAMLPIRVRLTFLRDKPTARGKSRNFAAADAALEDFFGHSVSIWEDTIVVGARYDDDDGDASGSAYIFTRDANGAWSQSSKADCI